MSVSEEQIEKLTDSITKLINVDDDVIKASEALSRALQDPCESLKRLPVRSIEFSWRERLWMKILQFFGFEAKAQRMILDRVSESFLYEPNNPEMITTILEVREEVPDEQWD